MLTVAVVCNRPAVHAHRDVTAAWTAKNPD